MSWSTPLTAVANAQLTAAQWNASVRDNLNETAAAKATTAGSLFVGTGVNTLAERTVGAAAVDTSQTTTSTSYTDLATIGPQVTVTASMGALVSIGAQLSNSGAFASVASVAVSGATTSGSSDTVAIIDGGTGVQNRFGATDLRLLTAGSNTFKMEYRVSGGTGTFQRRRIQVLPL